MDGYSITPQEERLKALRSLMPEVFNEGKIDWEKLKATLGENINFSNERYVLNWAGKSDAFRVMQQPSSATLVPCREESVDFDNTQNIFIEGENMEVLKVLQKSYFNKIKMIYIDPPYNTGNDSFIYPDKFSETKEEYMRRVGDKDEEGYMTREGMFRKNSKENGQYHSNWLNMMMPRLYLAKSLLREDGVILVSIDDNEVHNLRLLMNEIFGEENFVADLIWSNQEGGGSSDSKLFRIKHEHIIAFSKDISQLEIKGVDITNEDRYKEEDKYSKIRGKYYLQKLGMGSIQYSESLDYPIIAPDGSEIYPSNNNNGRKACWRWSKEKLKWGIENGFVVIKKSKDIWTVYTKQYLNCDNNGEIINRTQRPLGIIDKFSSTQAAKSLENIGLSKFFNYSKPTDLIKYLIDRFVDFDPIILDFFAGSGTTAQAIMELNQEDNGNRRYICVQLPELCDEKSEAYKAGYKTIAEISKERIRRAGMKIRTEVEAEQAKQQGRFDFEGEKPVMMPDLGFKVFKLVDSNFKQWRDIKGSDKEDWKQQLIDFLDPLAKNATVGNMVYELLLKSGKDLNSCIEHKTGYYTVNDGELILMLESATQETVDAVLAAHPHKVIALDNLFEGNDQLKTNTVLQMRDGGIEFKTI